MRWQGDQQSENVEDRRGMGGGTMMVGGGIGTLVLMLLVWLLGGDPLALLQQINQGPPPGGQAGPFTLALAPGQTINGNVLGTGSDTFQLGSSLILRSNAGASRQRWRSRSVSTASAIRSTRIFSPRWRRCRRPAASRSASTGWSYSPPERSGSSRSCGRRCPAQTRERG